MSPLRPTLVSAAFVGLLALAALASGVAQPVERPLLDLLVRESARRAPPPAPGGPDVAVVAIDPASLRAATGWPWPRSTYAAIVRRLEDAGARAVAFDLDLSTPSDPAEDAAFAEALAASGRVVLASFRQREPLDGGGHLEFASRPLPAFAAHAATVGGVIVHVDPDGVVRRVPETLAIHGEATPSLAHRALAVATGRPVAVEPEPLRVDYRQAGRPFPVIPVVDLLAGRYDPRDLAGRSVFVGATAMELQDLWATPVDPALPGVFIQALTYRTLAARSAGRSVLSAASLPAQAGLALVLSLAGALLGASGGTARALGLGGLGLGLLGAIAVAAPAGWLLPPVVPLGVLGLHYTIGLETVRRRVGRALARRDSSLAALRDVGDASSRAPGEDGLVHGLALLGEVVGARAVALHGVDAHGAPDGRVLEWRAAGAGPVGCAAAVARAARATELRQEALSSGSGTALYAPLRVGPSREGVLVVEHARPGPLGELELRTVATVGSQLALAAHNMRLAREVRHTFTSSIEAIASAVEARDGYTELHCRRLSLLAGAMARRLALPEADVEAIELGALLHDVGKIGIPDEVLLKPGGFTQDERVLMEAHVEIGDRIVRPIGGLADSARACVRHHHERWDGRGYPDGLAGAEIPLGARVVAIADVWDALTTARPYKRAYPPEQAREILLKERGAHFDPELVDLFLRILDEEGPLLLAGLDEEAAR